jgi:hypothetical protein
MRTFSLLFLAFFASHFVSAQFVARLEVKEPIPGVCNNDEVYALLPGLTGQVLAECSVSKQQMNDRLNEELQFLKDHPDHKDKGMIGLIINCEGKLVQCEMDNKTKSPELDRQIEKVFNSFQEWTAGTLNDNKVDTSRLFSFTIKKGKITLN